jgi:predicted lysophospholipase L1 biosynthesis ABC-type transport system permease subunit
VKDLVVRSPAQTPDPLFLVPAGVRNFGVGQYVLMRTSASIDETLPAIRTVLHDTWGVVPERHLRRLRDEVDESLTPFRAQSALLGLIAAACVPLAAIGVAGALLYSVRRRTRDVAIRIALGASPDTIRRRVVGRALAIAGAGMALGVAAGYVACRALAHLFFEIHPADPWVIAGVAAALLTIAWMAAGVPMRIAARVQPAEVLRSDA